MHAGLRCDVSETFMEVDRLNSSRSSFVRCDSLRSETPSRSCGVAGVGNVPLAGFRQ